MLRVWLRNTPALVFSHIKHSWNRVVDTLANEGVGKEVPFHAKDRIDIRDKILWEKCEELAGLDVGQNDIGHLLRQYSCALINRPTFLHASSPLTRGPHDRSG